MAGRENHTLDFAVTDPQHIHEEMDHAYATFHQLTRTASQSDLHRPSEGTRWTNQQLLFHMMFGYLIVRRLLRWSASLGGAGLGQPRLRGGPQRGDPTLPFRQLPRLLGRRHRPQPHSVTQQKLGPVLEGIIRGARLSLAAQGLKEAKITGDWAWVYGPWICGELS